MRLIVDASALLEAASLGSALEKEATELRARIGVEAMQAPALVVWEMGNRLSRAVRDGLIATATDASLLIERLLLGFVLDVPSVAATARTTMLAVRHALTFYDASYLELTQRDEDAVLISEDGPLREAGMKELGPDRVFDIRKAHARFGA